jgi:hypothetical protein
MRKSRDYNTDTRRLKVVKKAMDNTVSRDFRDIAYELERQSKWMAENMTTKELQMYIDEIREREAV